ncbi:hypothetical protein OA095_05210 [Candidatus Pelagibacter sp.]|nr:hypothetical protein [Candidatus Pelagibacter sp.]
MIGSVIFTKKNKKWKLVEPKGYFFSKNEKIKAEFELQSVMTNRIVNKIIKHGNCELPELGWSIKCYTILLKTLLNNWNIYFATSVKRISIT